MVFVPDSTIVARHEYLFSVLRPEAPRKHSRPVFTLGNSPSPRRMGRMLMPLQKRQVLLWKSSPPMMFDLILDVINGFSAKIGSMVQSSRWDGAIFLIIPGTSCLATIVLSLRDKRHSTTEALLKLAFKRSIHSGRRGRHSIIAC
jgi:hypothetical protein